MTKAKFFPLTLLILLLLATAVSAQRDPKPGSGPHAADDGQSAVSSATFNVDSTADQGDLNPGNGICQAANSQCTLRAAVEETNALPGMDIINIPAGTYLLNSQIVIEDSLFFTGAGKNQTILDGQLSTPNLKVRTIELLVCDSGNNSVGSYDPNGQRNVDFLSANASGLAIPGAVAVGDHNDVFVAGYSSGVHRFESDGSPLGLFIDPDDFLPHVFAPTDGIFGDFDNAPNRDYYVADYFPGNRILRYDRYSGAHVDTITGGGLEQPNNMAFYNDDLYVTSVGSDEVLRYDGDNGNFIEVFVEKFPSGSPTFLDRPRGLAFKGSSMYVANEESDSIIKFSANTGAYQSIFVSAGSGGLDKPSDIAFGPDGHLYVISRGNKSVLRYDGQSGNFINTFVEGGDIFMNNPSCLFWRTGAGAGPIVNMSGMTLQNGRSPVSGPTAGLDIDEGASVTFSDGIIRDNESNIYGGGVRNWGLLTLIDVVISGNSLPDGAGGMTAQGGGILNAGNLEMKRVAVINNTAGRGGGISNINSGRVEMTNSTISGNYSDGQGGGIRNILEGRVFINHSTIVNNEINGPDSGSEPDRYGAGIYNSVAARVDIGNSILADNNDNRTKFDADYAPDCWSATDFHFDSEGRNVIGVINNNCNFNDGAGDQMGDNDNPLDPQLTSLFNGAHNPFTNSPAVDAGLSSATDPFFFDFGCRPVDQLGNPRPLDSNSNGTPKCDIGAVEHLPPNDGDGADNEVEDGAPNGGDGNNDGIPDSLQARVASFISEENNEYMTLVSPIGTTVKDVQSHKNDGQMPPGVLLPFGRLSFSINGMPAGSSIVTALILPENYTADAYYKYGPTAGDSSDHWYEFMYENGTGARIGGNHISIVFIDGERGDADMSQNRRVEDPGAPAVILDEQLYMPLTTAP